MDRSDYRPEAAAELRAAVAELVTFIEASESRLLHYGFYLDDHAGTMTVVAVHPDGASLEHHLGVGGVEFRRVGEHLTLRRIEIYGDPGRRAEGLVREKAAALGGAEVVIRTTDIGFDTSADGIGDG